MIKILMVKIIVLVLLGNIYVDSAANEIETLTRDIETVDDIERLKRDLETVKDEKESALLYKQIGDSYVAKDDYKNAADAYISALSLARDIFSLEERTLIAIYMSRGGRLKESLEELRLILSIDPLNPKARIHLARVLSWSGELDEAIRETEKVLKESPDNRDALLVKASALRWRGDLKEAIDVYQRLLKEEEDFDVRLGLTYALLAWRDIIGAQESIRILKPIYVYQEEELNKLKKEMNRVIRPSIDIRYSYYNDSDDNRLNSYLLGYGFWLGNSKFDLNYRHTDAIYNTADNLSFRVYSRVNELFGVGGGLGLTQLNNDRTTNLLTWNLKVDFDIPNGTAGASLTRDAFTDTAQLIDNKINITNTSLYMTQRLTDRLSLFGSYSYRDFSDDNNAHDFQFSPRYLIHVKNPTIHLGYRFRYLDFNRQTGSGYFDPNDFISHQLFASLYFENGKFYSYLEPYGGHQSFERNGVKSDDLFGGVNGVIGYRITENALLELNAEGGNYAIGTIAGFRYFMTGIRFLLLL